VAPNRWVGWPYTKYHCSVLDVNQSAALVIMSLAEARRRGISADKYVHIHGTAETLEKDTIHRPELHRSPAIRTMAAQCLAEANISIDMVNWS
jgi:acetyl-CoA C-acetyltransferase